MSESGRDNKRKAKDKAFYVKTAKLARRSAKGPSELGPDMKGFLCTSNREKDCVREAYNILNEHADLLYGSESKVEEPEKKEELEIEDELSKEVADLKNQQSKPVAERRFQSVLTGVKGCVFIRTTVNDPSEMVDAIISKIEKSQEQSTKFLLRMLPIHATCKSNSEDISKTVDQVITEKLTPYKTFSLLVKVRNHNLKRTDLVEVLADIVRKKYPDIKVNLDQPEVSVVVEVLGRTCCVGIVTKYSERVKYNLLELAQKSTKSQS
nr:EOG090X0GPG [Macrothrix elegans]